MKLSNLFCLVVLTFTSFLSNHLHAQNHFQKKISNCVPFGINQNVNQDKVVFGRDSMSKNILIFQEEEGNIGWSIRLNDTIDFGNSSEIIYIKLLTRRQSIIANQVISGFSMGGFFSFTTRCFEFDSIGNILWNIYLPIYNTCNIFENSDGSYNFFGGLDFAENSGEAIYGKLDTLGNSAYIYKSSPNSQVRGFDFVNRTNDGGYFALGRKYNGNNFESVLMKFDSLMNPEFIKRINFGMDNYAISSKQLSDSSFIAFFNTPNDTSYIVKINPSGTIATALRIQTGLLDANLNSNGSDIFLSYTSKNNITGILRLNTNLNIINNYSIADTSLHAFITGAEIVDSNFVAVLSDGTNGWVIESDSLFSEACYYYPETFSPDLINLSLVDDSISFSPYGSSSPALPVDFYFTDPSPQWSDSCLTMINGINNILERGAAELFPNPVSSHFTIRMANDEKIKSINVFNLVGQSQKLDFTLLKNGDSAESNILNLQNGIYFLEIITENNKIVKRFIKD